MGFESLEQQQLYFDLVQIWNFRYSSAITKDAILQKLPQMTLSYPQQQPYAT